MRCLILGCVKDCEIYLDQVFNNIKQIQSCFIETKIILYYDNSNDNTLKKLKELKKKFPLEIIIGEKEPDEHRTINIEYARNQLLDKMYNTRIYNKYYYFIMMDMDDACTEPIHIDILKKWLNKQQEWDALSFHNKSYYDYWALAIGTYQGSCWADEVPYETIYKMKNFLEAKFRKKDIVKVMSAFNGFAIHKKELFKDCKYQSLVDNYYDCEHKIFYKNSKRNIMITKDKLFDQYKAEHNIDEIMDKIKQLKSR